MSLMTEIQQKNECLAIQRSTLLQQCNRSAKKSKSGTFLVAFIFAPFALGAVAPFFLVRQGVMVRALRTLLLPSIMPFLLPQVASRN